MDSSERCKDYTKAVCDGQSVSVFNKQMKLNYMGIAVVESTNKMKGFYTLLKLFSFICGLMKEKHCFRLLLVTLMPSFH